jgi:adenine deaminase
MEETAMTSRRYNPGKKTLIQVSRGMVPADILFTDAEIFNPFTGTWEDASFAVSDGIVTGIGSYRAKKTVNLKNRRVVPGLIDSHAHIESSLLAPPEFARLVASRGTTTIITDPHEIANVCGADGIRFMLSFRGSLPVDLFIMLPSCVPATPRDRGGAVLRAEDLTPFVGEEGVLGLGEMMDVAGVLNADPDVLKKMELFPLIDGHAPLLSGKDLNAYIIAGIRSDHESTGAEEAREKLERGMYLFVREGSAERNITAISPLITRWNCPRCAFATDDRHVDMLVDEGHIDDCIRKAVASGVELEAALRMATLTPAERFHLDDRGALVPGRVADFCLLEKGKIFSVEKMFRRGKIPDLTSPVPCIPVSGRFGCTPPQPDDISLHGSGMAKVIGLVPAQIITDSLAIPIDADGIPDIGRDILKAVVCNRFKPGRIGTALVHGFLLSRGAIAGSVSHDSHHIVAVGVADQDICRAISLVIRSGGGLAVVSGDEESVLPLPCAGLMSIHPYEAGYDSLAELTDHIERLGGIDNALMYLSFLALSVIPRLRITDRGLFDSERSRDIPIFAGT